MGQPVDHDHEPVGSMHPVEPFEPDDRDESIGSSIGSSGWLI